MFYDITNTAFPTSDLLYMTSHPLFRTSHHIRYDIKSTVSDLRSTVSVSSHPHYRWHHSHYMDGIHTGLRIPMPLTPGSAHITPVLISRIGCFGHHHRDDKINTRRAVQYKLPQVANTWIHPQVPVHLWCHDLYSAEDTPSPPPPMSPGDSVWAPAPGFLVSVVLPLTCFSALLYPRGKMCPTRDIRPAWCEVSKNIGYRC